MRFQASINERLVDKNILDDLKAFSEGFENRDLTLEDLARYIAQGFAYSVVLNGPRKAENFVSTSLLSVDIDDGLTIDEALQMPFVRDHCSFYYTTVSHTPDQHRFRLGFLTERPITDANEARMATRSLGLRLGGDPSVSDPARIFYGNSMAEGEPFNKGLPVRVLEELIAQSRGAVSVLRSQLPKKEGTTRSGVVLRNDHPITTAEGLESFLDSLRRGQRVHCPFHHDKNASAFATESLKGQLGIHCSTCSTTYWGAGADNSMDFTHFERTAKKLADQPGIEIQQDRLMELLGVQEIKKAQVQLLNHQYLPEIPVRDGITFIKSPKGSGKTEFLGRLPLEKKDRVLLVGHRQSLIKSMCNRLNLNCYLDDDSLEQSAVLRQQRYGVCLDSLAKVKLDRRYDYVLIDESEQVLSHFLSSTMTEKRTAVLARFRHILKNARRIIALDADLSWPSFHFLSEWGEVGADRSSSMVINEYRRDFGTIHLLKSAKHVVGDLKRSLEGKKKCYITSNSRQAVDRVFAAIKEAFPDIRQLKVTQETSHSDEAVRRFISDPSKESQKYDLILSSPSLSTGIDITFDGGATYFDCVYGIFEPQVLTHFGCDQQISRVRHPGVVKVYVSPKVLNFETSLHVVEADLLSTGMFGHLLEGFEPSGRAIFNTSDELLKLAAMITSFERSSTNRLRTNFIRHMDQQGWSVQDEASDKELTSLGGSLLKAGQALVEDEIIERLMNAPSLSAEMFRVLRDRLEDNEALKPEEQDSFWRTSIEQFYGCEISRDVIRLDLEKKSRDKVRLFAEVIDHQFRRLKLKIIDMKVEEKGLEEVVLANPRLRPLIISDLLSKTPLFDGARFDADVEITTNDLTDFVIACRKIDLQYQTQFRETLNQDLDDKPIKQLGTFLRKIGLKFSSRSSTKDGVKTYLYRINLNSLKTMQGIVERQKAGRREDDPAEFDHVGLSMDNPASDISMEIH